MSAESPCLAGDACLAAASPESTCWYLLFNLKSLCLSSSDLCSVPSADFLLGRLAWMLNLSCDLTAESRLGLYWGWSWSMPVLLLALSYVVILFSFTWSLLTAIFTSK